VEVHCLAALFLPLRSKKEGGVLIFTGPTVFSPGRSTSAYPRWLPEPRRDDQRRETRTGVVHGPTQRPLDSVATKLLSRLLLALLDCLGGLGRES
jgi:hypothetical protein